LRFGSSFSSLVVLLFEGGVEGKSTTVGVDLKPDESGGGGGGGLLKCEKLLASNPVG